MKFFLDMPVSFMLLDVLHSFGYEGVHAHQIGKDRASDTELLEIARDEGRIIITADLDFPRILALSLSKRPGLILFRGGNYSDREMCRWRGEHISLARFQATRRAVVVNNDIK